MSPREAPTRHRKIGPYRVLGEIGRGGMATVYRGIHELLQREVAIKELRPDAARDKDSLSRFRREALAMAGFRHENIVSLYDLVQKNDAEFMVMELVDGPSLSQLLRDGALPPPVAAVVATQLAGALEHAHFSGIIHRDIKPGNILMTKSGAVKLTDFGIAKDPGLDSLTREGMAVGTPSYMSPEQVMGGKVDARTDVFSLGVVLYECLAGARPFTGSNAGEIFARVRDGKYKPLSKAVPGVPHELAEVVRRAMRPQPDDRYAEMAEMRLDLEIYLMRAVKGSRPALMRAFLRARNKITETEALAQLSKDELALIEQFGKPSTGAKSRRWAWAMAAAAALAGAATALWATHQIWEPWLSNVPR